MKMPSLNISLFFLPLILSSAGLDAGDVPCKFKTATATVVIKNFDGCSSLIGQPPIPYEIRWTEDGKKDPEILHTIGRCAYDGSTVFNLKRLGKENRIKINRCRVDASGSNYQATLYTADGNLDMTDVKADEYAGTCQRAVLDVVKDMWCDK